MTHPAAPEVHSSNVTEILSAEAHIGMGGVSDGLWINCSLRTATTGPKPNGMPDHLWNLALGRRRQRQSADPEWFSKASTRSQYTGPG